MSVNEKLEKEVQEYELKYRGRELPGFINYKTFEFMVKEQVKQLEEPAVLGLKDIGGMTEYMTFNRQSMCSDTHPLLSCADAVRKIFLQLALTSFAGLPNLIKTTKVGILSDFDR